MQNLQKLQIKVLDDLHGLQSKNFQNIEYLISKVCLKFKKTQIRNTNVKFANSCRVILTINDYSECKPSQEY